MNYFSFRVAFLTLLTAAVLIFLSTRWVERNQVAELTVMSERTAVALDMQFKIWESAVDGLAASHALTRSFNSEILRWDAMHVAEQVGGWIALAPLDDLSSIVFNTNVNTPEPIRVASHAPELLLAIEKSRASGNVEISDVFVGKVIKTPVFAVVKVATSPTGKEYVLVLGLDVKVLTRELENATLHESGFITVIDGSYRIVARSSRINEFIFKSPPQWLVDKVKATPSTSTMVAFGPALPGAEGSSYFFTNNRLQNVQSWSVFVGRAKPVLAPSSLAVVLPLLGTLAAFFSVLAIETIRTRGSKLSAAKVKIEQDKKVQFELKDALEKAEASEVARRNMLSVLGHEMRTPVLSALAAIELFPENLKAQDSRSYLPLAEKGLKVLQSLIDDVLDVARINAGELHIEQAGFSITDVLAEVADIMGPLAKRHRLDFERAWPEKSIYVLSDRTRIRQILINLLTNAIRYTRVGFVTLEGTWQTDQDQSCHICLSVRDTGTGIPNDKLEAIFKPFYRIEQRLNERVNGLGLGLPITQKLASALGGSIEIQSQVGYGSTFSLVIDLPIVAAVAPMPEIVQIEANGKTTLTGKEILVVEDSTLQAELVMAVLQKLGAETETVGMGCEALEALRDRKFDIILIDLGLPDMTGVSLVRKLVDAGSTAIHIALSANPSFLTELEGALFDAVAVKTIGTQNLGLLIANVVGAKIAERPLRQG